MYFFHALSFMLLLGLPLYISLSHSRLLCVASKLNALKCSHFVSAIGTHLNSGRIFCLATILNWPELGAFSLISAHFLSLTWRYIFIFIRSPARTLAHTHTRTHAHMQTHEHASSDFPTPTAFRDPLQRVTRPTRLVVFFKLPDFSPHIQMYFSLRVTSIIKRDNLSNALVFVCVNTDINERWYNDSSYSL